MSNMYSLLNYVAATSKELGSTVAPPVTPNSPYGLDQMGVTSVETGLRNFDEDQRRLIGMSTISVVAQLALEFEDEEVGGNQVLDIHPLTRLPWIGDKADRLDASPKITLGRS